MSAAIQWLIAAALLALPLIGRADDAAGQPVNVHVVGNGWHAGLILPAPVLNDHVPALRERFPKAVHYEIGWGDLGFYQAREVTVGLAIEALFASKGSLLHVVGLPGPLAPYLKGADAAETCVPPAQLEQMVRLIAQAFVLDDNGQPLPSGPGLYGDSQFYKAHGGYSLLHTCNRWTAAVLQAGGLEIRPRISLTASSVLSTVRAKAKACPAPTSP